MSRAPLAILLVEDEFLIQDLTRLELEDGGFTVVTACRSKEAIDMLETQISEFRALITDVNLGTPKLTGWDVARRARELNPDLPVVYITADSCHKWSAMGVPNSILLSKPFATAQMLAAVSQLLNANEPSFHRHAVSIPPEPSRRLHALDIGKVEGSDDLQGLRYPAAFEVLG